MARRPRRRWQLDQLCSIFFPQGLKLSGQRRQRSQRLLRSYQQHFLRPPLNHVSRQHSFSRFHGFTARHFHFHVVIIAQGGYSGLVLIPAAFYDNDSTLRRKANSKGKVASGLHFHGVKMIYISKRTEREKLGTSRQYWLA